jgi:16S rRNA (guanine(1405)-N(7))-methyltransferase
MSGEIVERVLRSSRYRDVDRTLLARLAEEELGRSRTADEAVKRVKRRLHQAVGAFRGRSRAIDPIAAAWTGDLSDAAFRAACADALAHHASTRERAGDLEGFYRRIWALIGVPHRLLDLGCGLGPLALPWMDLAADATYVGVDVDRRPLTLVDDFLALVGQPHRVEARDLVVDPPRDTADVALLLKLVPTLDQQDPGAAVRLLRALRVRHAVVSFPRRSLGGRGRGMEGTYRARLERVAADAGHVRHVAEAPSASELVFVLTLGPHDG